LKASELLFGLRCGYLSYRIDFFDQLGEINDYKSKNLEWFFLIGRVIYVITLLFIGAFLDTSKKIF